MGVIGVGHLGNFHVQQLNTLNQAEIVGIHDPDPNRLHEMAAAHGVTPFSELKALLEQCDAVSIVTPTSTHFQVAQQALEQNCHLFIEKPITQTVSEAREILELASVRSRIIQVGHIEEFNPAFLMLEDYEIHPQFIECHRLAPFNIRGTDVPVVLDLMIHDIGIVLSLVQSPVTEVRASGVKVVSETVDIANARIEFENGCIANLTSSRISQKKMRKLRIFQENSYITVDFMGGVVETYRVTDTLPEGVNFDMSVALDGHKKRHILYHKPEVPSGNALRIELSHFVESVQQFQKPRVDGRSATEALALAVKVQQIIDDGIH